MKATQPIAATAMTSAQRDIVGVIGIRHLNDDLYVEDSAPVYCGGLFPNRNIA